jgi:hypothetical protein
MATKLHTMKRILLTMVAALLTGLAALAQSYSIDWHAIAGGGGTSTGGEYSLSGTVGQAEAGGTLSGGDYTLQGGFWPGLIVTTSGEVPQLFIQASGQGVTVSWAPLTPGFVLEMSAELGQAEWSPAPSGNPVLVPATDNATFYRLRKN